MKEIKSPAFVSIILFGLFIIIAVLAFSADEADLSNESYNDCCIDYCYNSEYPEQCCEDYCMGRVGDRW